MIKKISLILLIIITLFFISGCNNDDENYISEYKGFTLIDDSKIIYGYRVDEIRDDQTGVHYYINTSYRTGFMSPVYNSDGTVKVTK